MIRNKWSPWAHLLQQTSARKMDDRKFISFIYIVSALLGAFWLLFAAKGATYAAVELSAFEVVVTPNEVVVEWQTVSETDTFGFEVWFKEEAASQSAYRLIDKRVPQGALERGVLYRMTVTHLLKRDTTYCFQLRELPVNGERGEILVRCGYGLGISAVPTPTPTSFFTPTATITNTTILTPNLPFTMTGQVTMTGSITNGVLPTDTLPTDPFAVPNVGGIGVIPTPFMDSPLPTPFVDPQGIQQPPLPDGQSPLPTPTPPFTTTDPGAAAINNLNAATYGTPDPFSQTTMLAMPVDSPLSLPVTQNDPAAAQLPAPVGNPPYIVLTATPTSQAVAILPTFTAYPTDMPAANNLIGLRVPDTQNLMIMLLCGVFSGASGLGILGLVSTLLYMRSRRQNQPPQRRS